MICTSNRIPQSQAYFYQIFIKFLPPSVSFCAVADSAAGSRSEAPSQDSFCYSRLPRHTLILWRSWSALCQYCHIQTAKTVSPLSTISALSSRRGDKGHSGLVRGCGKPLQGSPQDYGRRQEKTVSR